MTDYLKAHDCSNCGDAVQVRRPSKSGKHFCPRPVCQAAKQRFHYRDRLERLAREEAGIPTHEQVIEGLRLALFTALVEERYLTDGCPKCGQTPALQDWIHPTPGWTKVCFGTGIAGNEPELEPYWRALYPS